MKNENKILSRDVQLRQKFFKQRIYINYNKVKSQYTVWYTEFDILLIVSKV